jgi:hypothetical protein
MADKGRLDLEAAGLVSTYSDMTDGAALTHLARLGSLWVKLTILNKQIEAKQE